MYGAVHLLRLMSRCLRVRTRSVSILRVIVGQLGSILAYSPLEQTEVDYLLVHIDDFNR